MVTPPLSPSIDQNMIDTKKISGMLRCEMGKFSHSVMDKKKLHLYEKGLMMHFAQPFFFGNTILQKIGFF